MTPRAKLWCATFVGCLGLVGLTACGGGDDAPAPAPAPAGIGPAGGTVAGPNGATIVVPAGALPQTVDLQISLGSAGAPALPAGTEAAGAVYVLTPHGTTFAVPVTLTVPFEPAQVPAGRNVRLLKTNAAQSGWEPVSGASVSGGTLTAQITRFSWTGASLVPALPTITSQPASVTVDAGQNASFSVAAQANGAPPLTYQWRRDGSDVAGATAASYTLANVTAGDSGATFSVIVGNGVGTVASAVVTLTVNVAAPQAPTITAQPLPVRVTVGGSATFSVTAGGTPPLAYQWQRANDAMAAYVDLAGANAATLTLQNLQLADDGARVRVRVSNAAGSTISAAASLTVTASCARAMPRRVAMGSGFAAAVSADGSVWTWGRNTDRQLGPGSTLGTDRLQPARVSGIGNAVAVFALFDGFAVLRADGRIQGWGATFLRTSFDEPVVDGVGLLDLTDIAQVAGGAGHTLALRTDGNVWAWGANLFGQLGDGSRIEPTAPVQVSGLTGVRAIGAPGTNASIAVRRDGTLWAWGSKDAELCLGSGTGAVLTPQQVSTTATFGAIATGNHTLLWSPVGELRACGRDAVSTVFTGADAPQPVTVPPVAAAASGRYYDASAAQITPFILTLDGAGLLSGYSAPAAAASGVNGFANACELSAGLGSALIVRVDGTVWAWGENDYGQLGDGTRTRRTAPVQVMGLNLN